MVSIPITFLSSQKRLVQGYKTDAGWDIPLPQETRFPAHSYTVVPLDFSVNIPKKYFGMLTARSSIYKYNLSCNTGIIDSGFLGVVSAVIFNHDKKDSIVEKGTRLVQLIILPAEQVTWLIKPSVEALDVGGSLRGDGGFGSTGV